jgi:diaminopimelate decarboxylase
MKQSWRETQIALERLLEHTNKEAAARALAPKHLFEPPVETADEQLAEAAAQLPTPAIVWDVEKLKRNVLWIRDLLAEHGFGLNVGLKACASRTILSLLSDWGLHADAMSMAEYNLAKEVGFSLVSATGPSFRPRDIGSLLDDGVLFDAQSYTQLEQLVALGRTKKLGVRFQVPRPSALRSSAVQSEWSRFGIPFDESAHAWFSAAPEVEVNRIRVHTSEGLSTDAGLALEFRTRLALLQAAAFGTVREINLGGGILALARNPERFKECLAAMAAAVEQYVSRLSVPKPELWLEPGAALLLDSAYLVTEVVDIDRYGAPSVVVDASPWNVAPWAYASFHVLGDEPWEFVGEVYGPTLYENDKFRQTKQPAPGMRVPRIGDRLLVTCFGAYTLTQSRRFGQFPLPQEYGLRGTDLRPFPEGVSV